MIGLGGIRNSFQIETEREREKKVLFVFGMSVVPGLHVVD